MGGGKEGAPSGTGDARCARSGSGVAPCVPLLPERILSVHWAQTLFRGLCRCACTDPQGTMAPLFGNLHVMKRRSQPLAFRTV